MTAVSPALHDALDRGSLVLAPTAFAAAELRAAFDHAQQASGKQVWQPANVLSWPQWLHSLWPELVLHGHESRLLLSTAQEELVWRDLVVPTLDPMNQGSAPAFAAMARSAFALAASYGITLPELTAAAQTDDSEQFARWAADFTRTCTRQGYLSAAQLSGVLAEQFRRQNMPAPPELHLNSFLESSPADSILLDVLRRVGARIVEHAPPPAPALTRSFLRSSTEAEELRAAAHWIRKFFNQKRSGSGPDGLPAVHVVLAGPRPDLARLDSIFREVLAPELDDISIDPSSAPWEDTAGLPLSNQPVITTLVRLLGGLARPLPLDDVTALLLSPHLGRRHDRNEAARFDAWALRDRPPLRPEFTFPELQRRAQSSPFGQTTLGWLNPLLARLRAAGDLHALRTYAAWSSFIRDVATAVDWPGDRPLSAAEFAATEAWDHLLDALATLDFAGRRVAFPEALAALAHQLTSAVYTLPARAPIRILSTADAAAVPCDALLLLQATDSNWPPRPRPHPLLPWRLQAEAGVPGADPLRDAARSERLASALFSAPHVLLTHAAEVDEAPQRLAPVLAHLVKSEKSWHELQPASLLPEVVPSVQMEEVVDDNPLAPLPAPQVPGGATVLQLQAACGFRAFAEIRLRSTEPRSPELGMDAGRAGSLLHRALELFWLRVRSQEGLNGMTETERDDHLMAAIEHAFSAPPFLAPEDPWDKAYRALQMERLFELLKEWLRYERNRSPFTVLDREQQVPLRVGPLELQLRVDRIDQVDSADGTPGTVLIDYKTGYDVRTSAWETERPNQPQLPLYTMLTGEVPLYGLAFARIRRGQFAWAGLQSEPGLLGSAKVQPDLAGLVEAWRTVLTRLAEQFAAGDHSVNPKSYPVTCTHCGQRFLCRLDPNSLLATGLETEEADAQEEPADG